MKRQAYAPLPGPPLKRAMVRGWSWQGDQGGDKWHKQQQQQQQSQIPALGDSSTPGAAGGGGPSSAGNAGAGGGPRPAAVKLAAPKGPVFVLGDAQALLYVIMNYVAQQNAKQARGRDAGYDLCKFKSDFNETYK
jgi:hypothetical protein